MPPPRRGAAGSSPRSPRLPVAPRHHEGVAGIQAAVGTALDMVHAPEAESALVEEGLPLDRLHSREYSARTAPREPRAPRFNVSARHAVPSAAHSSPAPRRRRACLADTSGASCWLSSTFTGHGSAPKPASPSTGSRREGDEPAPGTERKGGTTGVEGKRPPLGAKRRGGGRFPSTGPVLPGL